MWWVHIWESACYYLHQVWRLSAKDMFYRTTRNWRRNSTSLYPLGMRTKENSWSESNGLCETVSWRDSSTRTQRCAWSVDGTKERAKGYLILSYQCYHFNKVPRRNRKNPASSPLFFIQVNGGGWLSRGKAKRFCDTPLPCHMIWSIKIMHSV